MGDVFFEEQSSRPIVFLGHRKLNNKQKAKVQLVRSTLSGYQNDTISSCRASSIHCSALQPLESIEMISKTSQKPKIVSCSLLFQLFLQFLPSFHYAALGGLSGNDLPTTWVRVCGCVYVGVCWCLRQLVQGMSAPACLSSYA